MTKHVRNARSARRLEEEGLTSNDAAPRLGIKPYPAQKLYGQIRNFSGSELDDAVVRLAQLDHALKGGSRLANELELELALVDITAARGSVRPTPYARESGGRGAAQALTASPVAARAACDFLRAPALLVQRAARDRLVDQADERLVLRLDRLGVALGCDRREPLRQRLDRRAVAQVLQPLFGGDPDALLLLLDVRHGTKMPASARARAKGSRGRAVCSEPWTTSNGPASARRGCTRATNAGARRDGRSTRPRRNPAGNAVEPSVAESLDLQSGTPEPYGGRGATHGTHGRRLAVSTAIFAIATGPLPCRSACCARSSPRPSSARTGRSTRSRSRSRCRTSSARSSPTRRSSSAFVPVFNDLLVKGERKRAWRVASSALLADAARARGDDRALRACSRPG